jgi:hypothetical protein
MENNSATNPVTEFIADSVEKRFASHESLRNVSEEVFNIDEAFFRASLFRNILHLLTGNGDIKFRDAESQQMIFNSVDMLQQSLQNYLKTRTKAFQEGVQQVIDLTDAITHEINILVSQVGKLKSSGEDI